MASIFRIFEMSRFALLYFREKGNFVNLCVSFHITLTPTKIENNWILISELRATKKIWIPLPQRDVTFQSNGLYGNVSWFGSLKCQNREIGVEWILNSGARPLELFASFPSVFQELGSGSLMAAVSGGTLRKPQRCYIRERN